jgi:hypothetical protein
LRSSRMRYVEALKAESTGQQGQIENMEIQLS